MFDRLKRTTLAAVLVAATFVAAAAPAEARSRYRHDGGDDAAIAVGAGIIGLAIGAAIASDHRDGYYRERRYRSYPSYYEYDSYPRYRNYYYRDYRRDYRRNWRRDNRRWDRGGHYGNYRNYRHYRY
jgi:hypothetical protein